MKLVKIIMASFVNLAITMKRFENWLREKKEESKQTLRDLKEKKQK